MKKQEENFFFKTKELADEHSGEEKGVSAERRPMTYDANHVCFFPSCLFVTVLGFQTYLKRPILESRKTKGKELRS